MICFYGCCIRCFRGLTVFYLVVCMYGLLDLGLCFLVFSLVFTVSRIVWHEYFVCLRFVIDLTGRVHFDIICCWACMLGRVRFRLVLLFVCRFIVLGGFDFRVWHFADSVWFIGGVVYYLLYCLFKFVLIVALLLYTYLLGLQFKFKLSGFILLSSYFQVAFRCGVLTIVLPEEGFVLLYAAFR